MPKDRPCPREPEAAWIPGSPSLVAGCPCRRELIFRKVASSFRGK